MSGSKPPRTDLAGAAGTGFLPDEDRIGSIDQSRQTLLDEIGVAPELTFIRGYGNIGDELIWEGTRQLLSGHVYREIGIELLASSRGETAVLCGGGAFNRQYNEFMPEALAIAELRFERVIVLPSSFEVEEDRVRDVLQRTLSTVFAREHESYRRIAGLCRARLAHDCSFFFDFSPYMAPGSGTLNAFRTDRERRYERLPEDNNDISSTCSTLDEWLSAIARHELVMTDRAHVMIAAALMGKQVRYRSSSYFKLDAIAAACLQGFPVQKIQEEPDLNDEIDDTEPPIVRATREHLSATALRTPAPAGNGDHGTVRVTAVILSRNRPQQVGRAIGSVLASSIPVRVLVLDQNSGPPTRAALRRIADAYPNVDIRLADRNLGCAGGRKHAVELVDTEYVLFLDDDAELMPGALEHLVGDLDDHPEAAAVTALVVYTNGTVYHFGGWVEASNEAVSFEVHGYGRSLDDPALAGTGPSGWVPGTAALVRRQVLDEIPVDDRMAAYYEDNDWSFRVEQQRPGSFRRCRHAIAMHALPQEAPRGSLFVQRAQMIKRIANHAQFLRNHGVLMDNDLTTLLPALHRAGGRFDYPAARLLLEIVAARGTNWTLMEWMNGGLDPLFDGGYRGAELLRQQLHAADSEAELLRQDAASLRAELAALQAHKATLKARAEQAEQDQRARAAHLAWLEQRHTAFVAVENSRWWRLGLRLAPARRAMLRLEQAVRRDRGR